MKRTAATRRVAVVAYPQAQMLDVTGPLEVFAMATDEIALADAQRAPAYAIEVLAAKAGPVVMSSGLQLVANRTYSAVVGRLDTLLVAGGDARVALADRALLRWLRRMPPRVRRLGSVCSGAFVLAEAGLLDGRRATTHWVATDLLARHYPRVTVDRDALFVRDGQIYTSAGVTAGMDLALALVEEDFGTKVALAVARRLVLFLKRPGGQSQFSSHLAAQAAPRGPLQDVPQWITEHLDADLSVESLAHRAGMSPRNFARVFVKAMGITPAKFVERARTEQARRVLEDSPRALKAVASTAGFNSVEQMRRTFQRHLRVVPHDYRKRFTQQSLKESSHG